MNKRRSKFGRRDRGRGSSSMDSRNARRAPTEPARVAHGEGATSAADPAARHAQQTSARDRKHIKAIKAGRADSMRSSGSAFGDRGGSASKGGATFGSRQRSASKGGTFAHGYASKGRGSGRSGSALGRGGGSGRAEHVLSAGGIVEGTVSAHRAGYGFLRVEGASDSVFLPPREMRGLMHGDRARVRVSRDASDRWLGEVEGVVARGVNSFLGTLEMHGRNAWVTAADRRLQLRCSIAPADLNGARDGDWVIAQITRHSNGSQPAQARIK